MVLLHSLNLFHTHEEAYMNERSRKVIEQHVDIYNRHSIQSASKYVGFLGVH